jgi:hypothetical protein
MSCKIYLFVSGLVFFAIGANALSDPIQALAALDLGAVAGAECNTVIELKLEHHAA